MASEGRTPRRDDCPHCEALKRYVRDAHVSERKQIKAGGGGGGRCLGCDPDGGHDPPPAPLEAPEKAAHEDDSCGRGPRSPFPPKSRF